MLLFGLLPLESLLDGFTVVESLDELVEVEVEVELDEFELSEVVVVTLGFASVVEVETLELSSGVTAV